jgi:CubicO group peptidase (beta-lactamase class C family)
MLNVRDLEAQVEGTMAAARVPGLSLAVVQGEQVVYERGFGVTCVEAHGVPVTPETLFRIGSITKPLTGTAIMRLVDAGKLALDTPVREYVPWFAVSDPAATAKITPRLLLTHTSGLPHDHKPSGPRDPEALERRVREEVPRYPLVAPPGSTFSYSNTGIHVLAFLLETITGKHYVDALQELLFTPLEMERTTFLPGVAMTYPCALGHGLDKDGALEVDHHYAENAANYASGQAISTVLDLARFAMLHLHDGRVGGLQLLKKESTVEMHRPHVSRDAGGSAGAGRTGTPQNAYGLTFSVQRYKGLTRVGHGGAIAGFGATFSMAMERDTALITLYNRLPGDGSMERLADRVLDAVLGLPA